MAAEAHSLLPAHEEYLDDELEGANAPGMRYDERRRYISASQRAWRSIRSLKERCKELVFRN